MKTTKTAILPIHRDDGAIVLREVDAETYEIIPELNRLPLYNDYIVSFTQNGEYVVSFQGARASGRHQERLSELRHQNLLRLQAKSLPLSHHVMVRATSKRNVLRVYKHAL